MPTTIIGASGIDNIQDGVVGTNDIANNAVTTAKVADANITAAKLSGAQSGAAPVYGARAWCVFNGTTAGTNAPTSGGNVSTVTRNSAGNYTINFTTAMQDANYSIVVSGNGGLTYLGTTSTGSANVLCVNASTGVPIDITLVTVAIFR
jgi:hypothetical protein